VTRYCQSARARSKRPIDSTSVHRDPRLTFQAEKPVHCGLPFLGLLNCAFQGLVLGSPAHDCLPARRSVLTVSLLLGSQGGP